MDAFKNNILLNQQLTNGEFERVFDLENLQNILKLGQNASIFPSLNPEEIPSVKKYDFDEKVDSNDPNASRISSEACKNIINRVKSANVL